MPNNEISTCSIEETYQILENNFSLEKPFGFYRSKYGSLEEAMEPALLKAIKTELDKEEFLISQLTPKVIQGLINPKHKRIVDELILKLTSENTQLPMLAQIKMQLSEFIDFSKLTYYFSKSSWALVFHIATLQQFTLLTKLKFNFFLHNLSQFLEWTTEEDPVLVKIAETLIKDYFPRVATAKYPLSAVFFLKVKGTDCEELKKALLDNDIPALQEKLNTYHENMKKKVLPGNATLLLSSDDDDDFQSCIDEEEEKDGDEIDEFWDAENSWQEQLSNKDSLPHLDTILITTNENLTDTSQKNFIQFILTWLKKWIQCLRNCLFRNPFKNDIIDKNSSDNHKNISVQNISPGPETFSIENTIVTVNSRFNNARLTTPLDSHSNAFYCQKKEREECSSTEEIPPYYMALNK